MSVAKRSKSRSQIKSNRRSNRTKRHYNPPLNDAPSLSVSDAGYRLGVSVSTVKRLIRNDELAWFRTRGPNGHIRVLAESVEKFRQPAATRSAVAFGLAAGKRENVETLRAEIEERKLKRDLSKLDVEDAEANRQREAVTRAEELERKRVVEESRLRVARDRAERRAQQRERKEAEERREWMAAWVAWALNSVPKEAPREIALDVAQVAEETLARIDPEQPQSVVQRLVLAAVEKGLKPWRREKEVEVAVQEARKQLPALVQRFVQGLFEPSEWEVRAMHAAREAIGCLRADASYEEMRSAAVQVGKQIASDYEAEQAQARTQTQAVCERLERERSKKFLVDLGVMHVSSYLSKLHTDGEIWDEDFDRKSELQSAVRKALEGKLTGDESFEQVQRIARELVAAELGE